MWWSRIPFGAGFGGVVLAASLLVAPGCRQHVTTNHDGDTDDPAPSDDTGGTPGDDTGLDSTPWLFLVYIAGDNDLESSVVTDLNELERAGSSRNVQILVQVDRIEGFDDRDGDWTGARRYRIVPDDDDEVVRSEVLAELGEVDMGDPTTLDAFLGWATTTFPADHVALVLWNHGDGWSVTGGRAGVIASDDTSGSSISIAEGELHAALAPTVAARGPLDVVAFDACSMAMWEVAMSLRGQAATLAASQALLGLDGLAYDAVIPMMKRDPTIDARTVADRLAWSAGARNGEWTFSAVDIGAIDGVAFTLDALAAEVLDAPEESRMEVVDALMAARAKTRGADEVWKDYYLDLGDLGLVLAASEHAGLAGHGEALTSALQSAVIGRYNSPPFQFASGLSVMADLRPQWLDPYTTAIWVDDTRWDDLLLALRASQAP